VRALDKKAVVRMSGTLKKKSLRDYEQERERFLEWCRRWQWELKLPVPVWQVMSYAEWMSQWRGPRSEESSGVH